MYIVSSFFPTRTISMLAMVIVVCKASLLQMHLRTAHPGWITLDQRVQLVPCRNLIPGVMGDGSLDDFDLGLHVRFNADEMWLHDLRSVVWDLHSLNMWDFNVEGLGVGGRNRRLLRDLEHLVHFRSMNRCMNVSRVGTGDGHNGEENNNELHCRRFFLCSTRETLRI